MNRNKILHRLIKTIGLVVAAILVPVSAQAVTKYTYDFEWYSGADQPWVYEAAPKLVVEVYEDPDTPENDVFFTMRNNIDTELGQNSSIVFTQIDTGSANPDMFSSLVIWDYSPGIKYYMNPVGNPYTLIDIASPRIDWTGDYAPGKASDSAPKTDGINPDQYVTFRAILKDGLVFDDIIAAMNEGMVTTYVSSGPYSSWSQEDKDTYRAGAPAGLRFSYLVHSIVPNEWHPDGHGLFVTNSLVSVSSNEPPQITAVDASPADILDNETAALSVTATDPDNGPSALTYQWSVFAGGGSFDDPTSATPVYIPEDIVGSQTVTLRVEVSDGEAVVRRNLDLQVSDADGPPPASGLLTEDFSAGDLSDWSVWDEGTRTAPSDWRIRSEELVQRSNIWDGDSTIDALPKRGTYLLYELGLGWLDYHMTFSMRSEDNDTLGVMFRYIDENNYYRFSWDAQRSYRRLVKVENGVFTELASDTVPYVQGQTYQVEIVTQGDVLEVWIDGDLIFQVSDSSHVRGSIAFYSWFDTGAYFDDLVVEDLSGGAYNAFPQIASVSADPVALLDTETSLLTVVASDPDNKPAPLTYQWSIVSGEGSLDDPSSSSPVFTPVDVVGTKIVILRVEVSDGDAVVSEEISLQVKDADAPPPGPPLVVEDFESGDLSDWSIWDDGTRTAPSDWRIRYGELVQRSNIWDGDGSASGLPKLGTYLLYDLGMGWLDYRVTFTMRSEDNDTLGVMFRYIDENNYYRFSWDAQRGYRRLVKVENGFFTELASDNVPYIQGQSYQMEIVAQGDLLEVWIDGYLIFQVSDATHLRGSIAFYSWFNTGSYFDDLAAEDLSGGAYNAFPVISSIEADPVLILDTETSTLSVVAMDPDDKPSPLTYQWTVLSGGGGFDDPNSPTPVYTPDDVTRTQVVWVSVEVSDGEAVVSEELSILVKDADAPPPGPELMSEDFSSGDLSNWSVWDDGTRTGPSDWRVRSEELVQRSNIWDGDGSTSGLPKLGTYLLYDPGMSWTDYRVSFTMSSTDNDTLGIMFRYADGDNYYRFSWDAQRAYRRLVKVENGVFTELASDDASYVEGQAYHVEIIAQDDQLEVWIDDMLIFQVSDTSHPGGSIAFYSWFNTGSHFDDLYVEDRTGF